MDDEATRVCSATYVELVAKSRVMNQCW
jgi:hypothetical protein